MISAIVVQDNITLANHAFQIIGKNQNIPTELLHLMGLLLRLDNINSIDSMNRNQFLKDLREQLEKGFVLSNSLVEKLLSIEDLKKTTTVSDFNNEAKKHWLEIVALTVLKNSTYNSCQSIAENLGKAIFYGKISYNILYAYQEVIRIKSCTITLLNNVLDTLTYILDTNNQFENIHLEMLKCITLASEVMNISKVHIANKLLSRNDFIVKWCSYRVLSAVHKNGLISTEFNDWCNKIKNDLEENIGVNVELDLDLFETITVLPDIDYRRIRDRPQSQWNGELIILDLLTKFNIREEKEKVYFCEICRDIEKSDNSRRDKTHRLLSLVHRVSYNNNNTISLNEFYDGLKCLLKINFANACKILLNSKNPFFDLQKEYIHNLIHDRLLNNYINSTYIDKLALNMISKFDIDYSEHFLKPIKTLDRGGSSYF
ncbi:unnamed protein product [Rotaria sp. Silwood2]|nr:unnamed protein product [Rotaria sp. Silwood2]